MARKMATLLAVLLPLGVLTTATPGLSIDQEEHFKRIKTNLVEALGPQVGEDYYLVYRAIERISRANKLDERPWRFTVPQTTEVNATASELNLITFEGGLLQQLSGDVAGMACVIGHEMAHHTKDHGPTRREIERRVDALQRQALEEAKVEIVSAEQEAKKKRGIFGAVLGGAARILGRNSPEALIGTGVANEVLGNLNESQKNAAQQRAAEIYQENIASLNDQYYTIIRDQESEADTIGFQYVVRAGFDPKGCQRVMEVLSDTENAQMPAVTHPKPGDRLAAIEGMNTQANIDKLVAEGKKYLAGSGNPLGISVARDRKSLQVESRYGSQDSDIQFPTY
ncbi:M48 family metalloprotease [Lyngbya aestuarii]|uniref:M48 family metalloprotease n=1 Tax=Lyngbya aestuarii TaxID=118322 RepID=UPI00403E0BEB